MKRAFLVALLWTSGALAAQVVEGRVVNGATGAGVPGVTVRIRGFGDSADFRDYAATTNPDGRFRIEGVADGAYQARYTAKGFAPIPNPGGILPRFPVTSGGEAVRLEVKMQPLGALTGRVLDAAGNPVTGADIWLVQGDKFCNPPLCFSAHRQAKTDGKGQYRIDELAPGPWLVSATAPTSWHSPQADDRERFGWVQTFYPGVIDPQLAEPVRAGVGGERWSPDIKLAAVPVHRLRGTILDFRGDPVSKASVALGRGFGPTLTQSTKDDGSFEFDTVPDGGWRIAAVATKNGIRMKATQGVEIKRRDVENLELRVEASFTLRGKIVLEVPQGTPAPDPPFVDVLLVSSAALLSDGASANIPATSEEDGSLTAPNVYPGWYEIRPISDSSAPYYLDAIRVGEADASGSVAILSDQQPLMVTYKLGGGTVRGTIGGCSDGHVLLVPQELRLRRTGFVRVTACSPGGQFEFTAVRPGEYYGFGIAGDLSTSAAIFQDGELLKRTSSVTVHANDTVSPEIRMIVH